jgi:hypothetical protein
VAWATVGVSRLVPEQLNFASYRRFIDSPLSIGAEQALDNRDSDEDAGKRMRLIENMRAVELTGVVRNSL